MTCAISISSCPNGNRSYHRRHCYHFHPYLHYCPRCRLLRLPAHRTMLCHSRLLLLPPLSLPCLFHAFSEQLPMGSSTHTLLNSHQQRSQDPRITARNV